MTPMEKIYDDAYTKEWERDPNDSDWTVACYAAAVNAVAAAAWAEGVEAYRSRYSYYDIDESSMLTNPYEQTA